MTSPTVVLVDAYAAAAATGVRPATIRKWIQRGRLARHGYDAAGRVLVDLRAVQDLKSA